MIENKVFGVIMNLGEKIKYFRTKQGLTQSQLAGTFITRNMLSKIENGSASPSLATIEYITERLSLPHGFLISGKDDAHQYENAQMLELLKNMYANGEYEQLVHKCEKDEGAVYSDEISCMLADCYLKLGIEKYRYGDMTSAEKHFCACISRCDKTVYNTDNLRKNAKLYMNLINFYFGKYAGDFADFSDDSFFGNDCLCEYLYVYCLKLIESGGAEYALSASELPLFSNESYVMHIHARYEMSRGNTQSAKEIMSELLKRDSDEHTCQLLYNVYSDLEAICRSGEDYKNAYKYATLKGELYSVLIGVQ